MLLSSRMSDFLWKTQDNSKLMFIFQDVHCARMIHAVDGFFTTTIHGACSTQLSKSALECVDSFEWLGRKHYRFSNPHHWNAHAFPTNHDRSPMIWVDMIQFAELLCSVLLPNWMEWYFVQSRWQMLNSNRWLRWGRIWIGFSNLTFQSCDFDLSCFLLRRLHQQRTVMLVVWRLRTSSGIHPGLKDSLITSVYFCVTSDERGTLAPLIPVTNPVCQCATRPLVRDTLLAAGLE